MGLFDPWGFEGPELYSYSCLYLICTACAMLWSTVSPKFTGLVNFFLFSTFDQSARG